MSAADDAAALVEKIAREGTDAVSKSEFARARHLFMERLTADASLPGNAHRMAHLLVHTYLNQRKGYAWPGLKLLGEKLGLKERAAQANRSALIDRGWFIAGDRRGGVRPGSDRGGKSVDLAPNWSRVLDPEPVGNGSVDKAQRTQQPAAFDEAETPQVEAPKAAGERRQRTQVDDGKGRSNLLGNPSIEPHEEPVEGTHRRRAARDEGCVSASADFSFDRFWEVWGAFRHPTDTEAKARTAWTKAVKSGVDPAALQQGAEARAEYTATRRNRAEPGGVVAAVCKVIDLNHRKNAAEAGAPAEPDIWPDARGPTIDEHGNPIAPGADPLPEAKPWEFTPLVATWIARQGWSEDFAAFQPDRGRPRRHGERDVGTVESARRAILASLDRRHRAQREPAWPRYEPPAPEPPAERAARALWARSQDAIETQLERLTINSGIRPLTPLSDDGAVLKLAAESRSLAEYSEKFCRAAIEGATGRRVEIFHNGQAVPRSESEPPTAEPVEPAPVEPEPAPEECVEPEPPATAQPNALAERAARAAERRRANLASLAARHRDSSVPEPVVPEPQPEPEPDPPAAAPVEPGLELEPEPETKIEPVAHPGAMPEPEPVTAEPDQNTHRPDQNVLAGLAGPQTWVDGFAERARIMTVDGCPDHGFLAPIFAADIKAKLKRDRWSQARLARHLALSCAGRDCGRSTITNALNGVYPLSAEKTRALKAWYQGEAPPPRQPPLAVAREAARQGVLPLGDPMPQAAPQSRPARAEHCAEPARIAQPSAAWNDALLNR